MPHAVALCASLRKRDTPDSFQVVRGHIRMSLLGSSIVRSRAAVTSRIGSKKMKVNARGGQQRLQRSEDPDSFSLHGK